MLRFSPSAAPELVVYSDASWETRFSTSGGLVLFMGCVVAWWSRRQRSVSVSTSEAELFAAALASREGIFIRDLVEDIGYRAPAPSALRLDSRSAIDLAMDPVAYKKTKHILRHAYELRDRVARRVYTPEWVESAGQLADVLTKPLRAATHRHQLDSLLATGLDAPLSASGDAAASSDAERRF